VDHDAVMAQGSTVDIPGLPPGMTTQILSQGLLGIAVVFLLYVIWQLWKENKAERDKCVAAYKEVSSEVIRLGGDIAKSNSDVARMLEERGKQALEIMNTNARLAQSVDHLSDILELQHRQVTETLREIKAK
jgi:hypothetical protein